MEIQFKQYISMSEAARLKGKYLSWLQYYMNSGRCPPHENIAGKKVFKREDILKWIPQKLKQGRKKKKC